MVKAPLNDFYPRPPGGGRLSNTAARRDDATQFLSTPSGWRATAHHSTPAPSCRYFYPRPPGGGRRKQDSYEDLANRFLSTPSGWRATTRGSQWPPAYAISIHALRVEGDCLTSISCSAEGGFLSTPSGWRATAMDMRKFSAAGVISIHALRVEGDLTTLCCFPQSLHFYPRPPGGGRQDLLHIKCALKPFLSTPSGWRATVANNSSIRRGRFLSTPSGWRATGAISTDNCIKFISIHALRVEGDLTSVSATVSSGSISIHALRVEGDFFGISRALVSVQFLSTPSGWRATDRLAKVQKPFFISIHALRVEGDL